MIEYYKYHNRFKENNHWAESTARSLAWIYGNDLTENQRQHHLKNLWNTKIPDSHAWT